MAFEDRSVSDPVLAFHVGREPASILFRRLRPAPRLWALQSKRRPLVRERVEVSRHP